jgi:hypothetical protein
MKITYTFKDKYAADLAKAMGYKYPETETPTLEQNKVAIETLLAEYVNQFLDKVIASDLEIDDQIMAKKAELDQLIEQKQLAAKA